MNTRLSEVLKLAATQAFGRHMDTVGVRFADWAAEARDLEERLRKAELRLALLTEEG